MKLLLNEEVQQVHIRKVLKWWTLLKSSCTRSIQEAE